MGISCTRLRWGVRHTHVSKRDFLLNKCAPRTRSSIVLCAVRRAWRILRGRCVTTERASAISLLMHEGSGFSCAVTGSDGQEQEILRLRNANRDSPETLEYIDWRYRNSPDALEPRVFWLLSQDGQRIG